MARRAGKGGARSERARSIRPDPPGHSLQGGRRQVHRAQEGRQGGSRGACCCSLTCSPGQQGGCGAAGQRG
eukprot:746647-Hanusia_phi.AAC.3